jgi:hypothetical protein
MMHRFSTMCVTAAAAALLGWMPLAARAAEVQLEQAEGEVKATIDGKPFATYMAKSGHQPIIWPIIGPGGQAMTRQYPMGDALEGEETDHGHHRSLWFNHGIVNGLDFWLEPGRNDPETQIVQREIVAAESGSTARLVTRNHWMNGNLKVCEDERTILFGSDSHGRWIDFTVVVTANEGELVFGDTKEGAFGMRVPGTMSVDSKKGGKIRNSRHQEDAVAWGQPAEWVDYSGPVDGQPVGITIFDMPDSFRHPTQWHVRTYGLFAANPFGKHDFPYNDSKQGEAKLKQGESLRLHYRVLFYAGELSLADLAAIYEQYTEKE